MMRKVKKRSIITSLGAAAMLASLSVGGTAFAARIIKLNLKNIRIYKLILIH